MRGELSELGGDIHTLNALYMIPAELCDELAVWADQLQ